MEHYKSVDPVRYYQDYLAQNIRPDGRGIGKFRQIAVNISSIRTADGSAVVRIGNSSVICGIKAELAAPKAEEPDIGFVLVNVELPPLCCREFKPGPPSEKAQILTAYINDVISNAGVLDLKTLCIAPDKLVWVLNCDIVCFDYDGSVTDACFTALISALYSVTLPKVEYDIETAVTKVHEDVRVPLTVLCEPISATFAIFNDNVILADPCNEEEAISTGILTIVTDGDKLYSVHKPGGIELTVSQMQDCITKAKTRSLFVKEMIRLLK